MTVFRRAVYCRPRQPETVLLVTDLSDCTVMLKVRGARLYRSGSGRVRLILVLITALRGFSSAGLARC